MKKLTSSGSSRSPEVWRDCDLLSLYCLLSKKTTNNYEAISSPDSKDWVTAINYELNSMKKNEVNKAKVIIIKS